MIKSSKVSIKFANKNKLNKLHLFINEYINVVKQFIDIIQELDNINKFLNKDITNLIDTQLSARMIQAAGKQASGIVRGCRKKQEKRLFVINKLESEKKYKKARKLKIIYNNNIPSKPILDNLEPELDSRFFKIDLEASNKFDGQVTLSSIGDRVKLVIPFKKTRHLNKLLNNGKIKNSIRVSNNGISFSFDLRDKEKKKEGETIGIDIGVTSLVSCSNGVQSKKDIHGYDLAIINKKLCKKIKGSKSFKKCQKHRQNFINYTINKLNFNNVKEVRLENIRYLRKSKKCSRYLSHFTYKEIFDKIENKCIEQGVLVKYVNPVYTSQRCSSCGQTRKRNRNGKQFKCTKCCFELDADLNASINISFNLPYIRREERLRHNNIKGFYQNVTDQKTIVSDV